MGKNNLQKEFMEKIEIMEGDSYNPGPPLSKKDLIGISVIALICIIGLIWGVI